MKSILIGDDGYLHVTSHRNFKWIARDHKEEIFIQGNDYTI